jgi:cytochrome c-type biogenesis protein CcmH/NrfG
MEGQINGFGYRFLWLEKPAEAVRLLRINTRLYPDSWNVWDSLGDALVAAGDPTGAVAMYEKSLVLNPQNEHGKQALAGIRGEVAAN